MTHPSLTIICEWPADPADITPELVRKLTETGEGVTVLRDIVRECLAVQVVEPVEVKAS